MAIVSSVDGEPVCTSGLLRDISLGGCSFLHSDPLPSARVALTFGLENERTVTLMLRLTWCRFTQHGVYQSGGRFLKTIDLPQGGALDWRKLERG